MEIQLAIDLTDLEKAMEVAGKVAPWIDIMEAGTPLIKSCGMESVSRLRKAFPDKKIMADTKTADVGFLEAELCSGSGADFMTVLAMSPDGCVAEAVRGCREFGMEVLADTIGVTDIMKRSEELKSLGIGHVILHKGIDEGVGCESLFEAARKIKEDLGLSVSVAGGINDETAKLAKEAGIDVVIVGRHITASSSPEDAAKNLHDSVKD